MPQNVIALTKQLVLDEIGCAMGALSVDQARIIVDYAKDIGGNPEATIFGQSKKVPCYNAAGANSFLAFTLDYDETYRNYSQRVLGELRSGFGQSLPETRLALNSITQTFLQICCIK